MKTTAYSAIGLRKPKNDDRYLCEEGLQLFAVFDGIGGYPHGDEAAQLASQIVRETYEDYTRQSYLPADALLYAFASANTAISMSSQGDPESKRRGTTGVALVTTPANHVFIWSGDSRLYLLRGGRLSLLTKDHYDERRRAITRALGYAYSPLTDSGFVEARAGDVLLLCSDGLSNVLPDAALEDGLSIGAQAKDLVLVVQSLEGRDDATAVVVRV